MTGLKAERIRRKQEEEEDEMSWGGLRKAPQSMSMRMLEQSLPPEGETRMYSETLGTLLF